MRYQARLRRLEGAVSARDRLRGEKEVYIWDPLNPQSTAFVREQTFEVSHRHRRYEIHIAGEPTSSVYRQLAKDLLPTADTIPKMTDEELQACQEQYLAASIAALNASRRRQGLPPVFEKGQTAPHEKSG